MGYCILLYVVIGVWCCCFDWKRCSGVLRLSWGTSGMLLAALVAFWGTRGAFFSARMGIVQRAHVVDEESTPAIHATPFTC